jgi:molybdenum cofactor cytidylyltransferase
VILAAGTSSRVGQQKLLMDFRGRPLIEYAIEAAQRWNPVIVTGDEVCAYLFGREGITLLRNDEPQRGMSHSLAIADHFLPRDAPMIVLLGDKPLVTPTLIETVCDPGGDADVVYPMRGDEPGHPVYLSPRARACIGALPRGDTLRVLRANPHLIVRAVQTEDAAAFFDIDTADALRSSSP